MKAADKIKELEERIKTLEARPIYVPIYVGQPALPQAVPYQPWQPYSPHYPWWSTTSGGVGAVTCDMTQLTNGAPQ